MSDSLLQSLAAAVAASPQDAELRTLYGARLADAGRRDEAIGQVLVALSQQPDHAGALELFTSLNETSAPDPAAASTSIAPPDAAATPVTQPQVDWRKLEYEIGNTTLPPFVVTEDAAAVRHDDGSIQLSQQQVEQLSEQLSEWEQEAVAPTEVTRETLTLDDVGGLEKVKQRIRESFLDPMANPEIAKAFKMSLRGGLLLYGPPGCGKTFIARAIAGELGASFISVTLADVLSKWIGESEGNIHKTFMEARQKAPAVLFLDEIDAIGGKRSSQQSQYLRSVVNQLLMEMDCVDADNEGVDVLAATNMPWDVDTALLRPGRFDRMVLVLPPDEPAREAILRLHLRDRPIEGIDLGKLARATEGFSGADLQHLCETAAEKAMADSLRAGEVRPMNMKDLQRALKEVKPSIGPWLDSARNVAMYANNDGRYDDLVDFLRASNRL